MNFDHCAILTSLYPPQVALRRRCSEDIINNDNVTWGSEYDETTPSPPYLVLIIGGDSNERHKHMDRKIPANFR